MIFRQKCVFYVTLVVIKYQIKSYLVAEYVKSQIGICTIISSKLNDIAVVGFDIFMSAAYKA